MGRIIPYIIIIIIIIIIIVNNPNVWNHQPDMTLIQRGKKCDLLSPSKNTLQ